MQTGSKDRVSRLQGVTSPTESSSSYVCAKNRGYPSFSRFAMNDTRENDEEETTTTHSKQIKKIAPTVRRDTTLPQNLQGRTLEKSREE